MPPVKQSLIVELSAIPAETTHQLQNIKDAMVQAILQKINATGITDAHDEDFEVWQAIYLEANHCIRNPTEPQ